MRCDSHCFAFRSHDIPQSLASLQMLRCYEKFRSRALDAISVHICPMSISFHSFHFFSMCSILFYLPCALFFSAKFSRSASHQHGRSKCTCSFKQHGLIKDPEEFSNPFERTSILKSDPVVATVLCLKSGTYSWDTLLLKRTVALLTTTSGRTCLYLTCLVPQKLLPGASSVAKTHVAPCCFRLFRSSLTLHVLLSPYREIVQPHIAGALKHQ